MAGFKGQAWVTSVLSDDDVPKALVLARSLRKSLTSRSVAVVVFPKISMRLRDLLNHEFDSMHILEEDRNVSNLKMEDFAKVYALTLRIFEKCVFLSSNMLVMRNCDQIFDLFRCLTFMENMDTSVFAFRPSMDIFKALIAGTKSTNGNKGTLEKYIGIWHKNQHQEITHLPNRYNCVMSVHQGILRGNEKDIAIINFMEDPRKLASPKQVPGNPKLGLVEQMALTYWNEIYQQDVKAKITETPQDLVGLQNENRYEREPIAIIGMSCRYPDSDNIEEFWHLLANGLDGVGTAPEFRWNRDQATRNRPDCRRTAAGFLKGAIDEFDAKFFGLSPKEATFMDPQHRLLHELVWEGLEDAGIDALKLAGSNTGTFVGSWTQDFKDILIHAGEKEFYRVYMGNAIGAMASRISHLLKLTGPSVATESGCSSSMVAVHLGCRSLLLGETNLALACGVNLLLHPFDKEEMPMVLSPTYRCKTFDSKADGFARAEGCGVLVLKRLSDAVRDRDRVWGLIRGSGMSQEGISKSMGTPTVHCESLAMELALKDAHVNPVDVSYVEAHGTGTPVGDPLEVAAIAKAYGSKSRTQPLVIGSVKTNVGHTESCSGITGIMKVVLALENEVIPPHINFESLNPAIDLSTVPAVIPLEPVNWPRTEDKPRIAGVSSFGITGTDAHVIIEEVPKIENLGRLHTNEIERPLHILKISAKSDEALEELLQKYKEQLMDSSENFADFAYTANYGRASFNNRAVLVAHNQEEALQLLAKNKIMRKDVGEQGEREKICFLFTGQGSQYPGMAKTLYETSPVFRQHFEHCEMLLKDSYNISIRDVLWASKNESEVNRTIYSQTSIFCVEYALLRLWQSWGIQPDYVLGHSLGEFAAAVCANILTVEDAVKLVAERSRLIDELPRGKMLVIKADKTTVDGMMRKFSGQDLHAILDYAAVNSDQQTVVAGDSDVIEQFSQYCTERNLKTLVLGSTHAFHSRHMDPMLEKYRAIAKTVKRPRTQTCEYISGMRGQLVKASDVDAEYWVQHTREKVDFMAASKAASQLGCQIYLEVGPQPVLSALTMMNNDGNLACFPSLKKNQPEWETLLDTLAKLYLRGLEIDWQGFEQFYNRRKIRIPHYPFQRKRYWPDMMALTGNTIHPLLGTVIPNASSSKLYQNGINLRSIEFVKDHAIGNNVIFPGSGYLEMCLAAGHATIEGCVDSWIKPTRPMKIENLLIEAPLALEEAKTSRLQVLVDFIGENGTKEGITDWNDISVKIFHRFESDMESVKWLAHASATFSPVPTESDKEVIPDLEEIIREAMGQPPEEQLIKEVYDTLSSLGLKFGPAFQSLEKVWKCGEADSENDGLLAQVKIPVDDPNLQQYIIHPVVLDAMVQAIMLKKHSDKIKRKLHVPIAIGKFIWLSSLQVNDQCFVYTFDNKITTTAILSNQDGKLLGIMSNVEFIDTTVKAVESVLEQQVSAMPDLWEESWIPKLGPTQNRIAEDLLNDEHIYSSGQEKFTPFNVPAPEMTESFKSLEKYVYYWMLHALYECGWEPVKSQAVSFDSLMTELGIRTNYYSFVKYFFEVFEEEGLLSPTDTEREWIVTSVPIPQEDLKIQLKSPLFTEALVKKFDPARLIRRVGENLADVLLGKQGGLSVLFPEQDKNQSSVSEFYEDYGKYFNVSPMITELIRHRLKCWNERVTSDSSGTSTKYVYRVLEVGAGTGVFSNQALKAMTEEGIDFEYVYTDISPVFFSDAEKRFENYLKNMRFKKFNIEEDPISQGFTPEYFDLVIASDVIHATEDVGVTLRNLRKLLRPGGTIDIMEQINKNRIIAHIFGLMDGFWKFNDQFRENHCILTSEKWRSALQQSGFTKNVIFPAFGNRHGYIIGWAGAALPNTGTELGRLKKPTWIVFTVPGMKLGEYLQEKLTGYGRQVLFVVPKEAAPTKNGTIFCLNEETKVDFQSFMEKIMEHEVLIEGVVYLWSLDKSRKEQTRLLQPFLYLTQEVSQLKQKVLPRLLAVTEGVAPIDDNDLSWFHNSPLYGFVKTMRNEHTDMNCRCIAIQNHDTLSDNQLKEVFHEIWSEDKETQVAYNGGARYLPRFQPLKPSLHDLPLPGGTDRFKLILPESKSINDLQFGPLDHFTLDSHEIEIQVKTSALNFRDVFSVLKPTEEFKKINSVGFDFSGVVRKVHPSVSKWKVGDYVFGVNMNGDPLPSHVKLHEDVVLEVPKKLTLSEACTLPAVVCTAYHCLIDVAKIKPSDIVLIHTASGGVGLSAIEIVKSVGATIIATAGGKRKKNYLKSLGIKHIFHSRNTDYGEQILKVTGGHGVDVVLNSLTSEGFKEATLKACAEGARFIEMSKLSTWTPEEVRELRPDVKYAIVDLSTMESEDWKRLMRNLKGYLDGGVVNPIPYVRFDGVNVREALRYLQNAKHIGKVVCVMPELKMDRGNVRVHTSQFNDRSTYLITGGLGGIGFEVAKWMVNRGAKHVILAGRSSPSEALQDTLSKMNATTGANLMSVQLDVGNYNQCRELLEKITSSKMNLPPLRGVMHAAGTLADGLIVNQTDWGKFSSTFNTKINGTLNLHELTKNCALEHFVLFSSVVALFGSPGQSNHAAGNNFEDSFAHYRHSMGLPATTINWGQWGQVGIATEVDLPGMKALSTLQGLAALEYVLKAQRVQTCVLNMESFVLFSKLSPQVAVYLDEKIWKSSSSSSGSGLVIRADEFWQEYDTASSREEKVAVLKDRLRGVLRFILKLDEDEVIDDHTNFQEMGVDSLMFVEIKNALQNLLGERTTVSASALRDCNNVQTLANQLIKLIEGEDTECSKPPTSEEVIALLREDSELPEEVSATPGIKAASMVSSIETVLLTGATGTLGPYILHQLSNRPHIKKIYCLVRPTIRSGEATAKDRLLQHLQTLNILSQVDSTMIEVIEGNVSKEKFGLEDAKWSSLADSVEAIFHCAIKADHTQYYRKRDPKEEDVRAVNIRGLKHVLQFASENKLKYVFHASSLLSVSTTDEGGRLSEDWPEVADYDGLTSFAYPISKFVGDILIKKAVERGIPCKVFRFPIISGESETGRSTNVHQNHLMLRYFYIMKCGVMPSNPFPLVLIPADECAKISMQLFFDERTPPSDIYNITHDKPNLDQEFPRIAELLGYSVDVVEFAEFVEKLKGEPDDSAFSMFKQLYKSDDELMATYTSAKAARIWLEGEEDFWVSRKVSELLPDHYKNLDGSINCLYRDLQFAKREGYFERFGLVGKK